MAENRPPGTNRQTNKVPGSQSVRRNLFGTSRDSDVSFNNLARDRDELLKRQENEFKQRWNFDIANDKPLDGRYEWSKVIPLTTSASLLHVPSDVKICVNASNGNCKTGTTVSTTNSIQTLCSQSNLSETTCIDGRKTPTDVPPFKKQRSSDSDDVIGSPSHSK